MQRAAWDVAEVQLRTLSCVPELVFGFGSARWANTESQLGDTMNPMLVTAVALLAGLQSAQAANNARPGTPASGVFDVRVVSSAPHQVTGGDARLHVVVPHTVPLHQVEI